MSTIYYEPEGTEREKILQKIKSKRYPHGRVMNSNLGYILLFIFLNEEKEVYTIYTHIFGQHEIIEITDSLELIRIIVERETYKERTISDEELMKLIAEVRNMALLPEVKS